MASISDSDAVHGYADNLAQQEVKSAPPEIKTQEQGQAAMVALASSKAPTAAPVTSSAIAGSSPKFKPAAAALNQGLEKLQETAVKSFTKQEQAQQHQSEEKLIKQQFGKHLKIMEPQGKSVLKLSRRVTGYSSSYFVSKEGQIFRQTHVKVAEVKLPSEEIKETLPVTSEEKRVGEGSIKRVSNLLVQDKDTHVIGIAKKINEATGEEIKVKSNAIDAAAQFHGNPRLAAGTYVTWTSSRTGEKKEGFIEQKGLGSLDELERIDPDQVVLFGLEIAESLKEVHKNGWAHRDLKPANILIFPNDELKLADFDLAHPSAPKTEQPMVGTPDFMAPETVLQETYDPQMTDIFAFGVTLFDMFENRPLFPDLDTPDEIFQNLLTLTEDDLQQATGYSNKFPFQKLLLDMMHPDPSRRPNIDEVIKRLKEL